MNKYNLDYIDSMRGIAIFMVLVVHSSIFFDIYNIEALPMNFQNIIFSGKYGVVLFFIVSSYTLFRSLDIRKEIGYKKYFVRRFLRIAPLYYCILILMYLFSNVHPYYLENPELGITFFNLVTHLIFINGLFTNNFNSIIGVEWTIFVEVIFYIFLPVLFVFRKYLLKLTILFTLVSLLTAFLTKFFVDNELIKIQLKFSPLIWMMVFMYGALIYNYQYNKKIQSILINKKYLISFLVLLLFIVFSYFKIPASYFAFSVLLSLFFMLNKYNNIKIFNNYIFKKLGQLSFSIYLLHFPIFHYIKRINVIGYEAEGGV